MASTSGYKSSSDLGKGDEAKNQPIPNLWERLPEALVEQVLAKLPFSSLVRFCCVCKRWRNLILSGHSLLFFHAGQLTVRNSSRGVWEVVPLHFLQVEQLTSLDLVASTGGLLCFRTSVFGEFIMCNPLTKGCKRLQMPCGEAAANSQQPCMPTPSPAWLTSPMISRSLLVGVVLNSETGHFQLVVAAIFRSPRTTLVYDSYADSWKKVTDVPQGGFFRMKPISCSGNLYCSLYCGSIGDKLLKYDGEQQTWSWILFPEELGFPRKLIEHNGKVLLMTIDYEKPGGFAFFEVQDLAFTSWLPANPLPLIKIYEAMRMGIPEYLAARKVYIECLGEGDVMCFAGRIYRSDSVAPGLDMKLILRVWIHNFSTNSDALSGWEEWQYGELPLSQSCQFFKPSLLPCARNIRI